MRAHFGLPSVEAEDKEGKPPISVKFEIPYFTTSGIQVRARVCGGPEQTWTPGTQSQSRPRGLQVAQQRSQLGKGCRRLAAALACPRAGGPCGKRPVRAVYPDPALCSSSKPRDSPATRTGV